MKYVKNPWFFTTSESQPEHIPICCNPWNPSGLPCFKAKKKLNPRGNHWKKQEKKRGISKKILCFKNVHLLKIFVWQWKSFVLSLNNFVEQAILSFLFFIIKHNESFFFWRVYLYFFKKKKMKFKQSFTKKNRNIDKTVSSSFDFLKIVYFLFPQVIMFFKKIFFLEKFNILKTMLLFKRKCMHCFVLTKVVLFGNFFFEF